MKTCNTCACNPVCNHMTWGFENCLSWQPIIVYCCACKHAQNECDCMIECDVHKGAMRLHDFCSYGKRKDGDEANA